MYCHVLLCPDIYCHALSCSFQGVVPRYDDPKLRSEYGGDATQPARIMVDASFKTWSTAGEYSNVSDTDNSLFVTVDKIHAVSAGRGGGSCSSRCRGGRGHAAGAGEGGQGGGMQ